MKNSFLKTTLGGVAGIRNRSLNAHTNGPSRNLQDILTRVRGRVPCFHRKNTRPDNFMLFYGRFRYINSTRVEGS